MVYDGLFDSGTQGNLILRSVADELGLRAYAAEDAYVLAGVGGTHIHVKDYVKPDWRLLNGKKQNKKFRLYIVKSLPSKLHVLVGSETISSMNINFRADKRSLVLQLLGGKGLLYPFVSEACMNLTVTLFRQQHPKAATACQPDP